MIDLSYPEQAAAIINKLSGNFKPKIAIILGSGLGEVARAIEKPVTISYSKLPKFIVSSVAGHAKQLHLGMLYGVPVVCLEGRTHLYEGGEAMESIRTIIRTLKLLGVEILFNTNAAGSLRTEVGSGCLVAIKDQINFMWQNPLTGPNDEKYGERFVSMDDAYDSALREKLFATAKRLNIPLVDGIYLGNPGPTFETHIEIRVYKSWGADLVGMSTIPEVILARHADIKVVAVSVVTNLAAGLGTTKLSHEETLEGAAKGVAHLTKLIIGLVQDLKT